MKIFMQMSLCLLLLTVVGVSASFAQKPRVSQRGHVEQSIGTLEVKITYHRPNKKGRVLWGDGDALVPNGKVWRSGANEATVFEFTEDVTINGKPLPAGKYSFYTIPWAKEWTLIFNKTWDQWGTVYDEKLDALRVQSDPAMSGDVKETLSYTFEDVAADSAVVILSWGDTRVPFTVRTAKE